MITHSIKWRILAWNNALLAVVVAVLLTAFYRHECENRMQMADVRLRQTLVIALPGLDEILGRGPAAHGPRGLRTERTGPEDEGDDYDDGGPDRRDGGEGGGGGEAGRDPEVAERRRSAADMVRALDRGDIWCVVMDDEGKPAYRSANAPALDPGQRRDPRSGDHSEQVVEYRGFREIRHSLPGKQILALGLSLAPMEAGFRVLARELTGAGLAIVGAGFAIGWILTGRSLRPISRISATAERIAAGDYASTIDIADTESELGRLAAVLNNTFAGLNTAREQIVRFTADASHELRTPLAVILASSQNALRRERSPEEYRTVIESTERAAKRMKTLTDDLLELARGGAGKDALQTLPCDLADLADEAVSMLSPLAKQHGALITTDLNSCPVEADPLRVGRVAVNLISNAILHNGAGVRINVFVGIRDGRALLEVTDTGKGIPAEHLGKIFDRFHRADASRSRNTGGSGLGLAIVRQTVESHGGEIAVTSETGRGTMMRVSLPPAK